MAYLGIDLGGTYARAAVVDAQGALLTSAKVALTDRTPHAVVETIALASSEALSAGGPVDGCGVGVAGMLEGDSGMVAVAPNLGWRNVPFGPMLAQRLGRPVRVVNDLSAAAWGELHAGAGRGMTNLLVVFVGSGVGSALVVDGRLVRGAVGAAGEFGHVKVVAQGGRLCGCGQYGCLEAYAGGHNLIAQMMEIVASGEPSLLRERSGGDTNALTPVLLEQAAAAGDAHACTVYERACGYLGFAIANQISVLNPSGLILGGGVLSRCPGMRQAIVDGVTQYTAVVARRSLKIADAALGDDSGLIGAALLAGASS